MEDIIEKEERPKKKKIVVAEGFQTIRCFRSPMIKNNFGESRVMEDLGVIKGLSLNKTKNYILIPTKHNSSNSSWMIYALNEEDEIKPATYNKLHVEEEISEQEFYDKLLAETEALDKRSD